MHFISVTQQRSALQGPLQHLEQRAESGFVALKATKIQIGVGKELAPQKATAHNRTLKLFLSHLESLRAPEISAAFQQCLILAIEEESTYLLIHPHFIKALLLIQFALQ